MGALLPNYRKTVIDSLVNGISTNAQCIFAFAANPVPSTGNTPAVTLDGYNIGFFNDWNMLFGKRLNQGDIVPVIKNVKWTTNTVFDQYDNTKDQSNANFYAITPPQLVGGPYNVFKCINNANGAASTQVPNQVQSTSFTMSDGYTWRYIATITNAEYTKFYTSDYAPIYTNATLSTSAFLYAGVENVVITNGGNGYSSYSTSNTNVVLGVINSTAIQIQNYESTFNDFYVGNGIYIYNSQAATSQIFGVSKYVSNAAGNFVILDGQANVQNIQPAITKYLISPRVNFTCDGNTKPQAYTTINATSNSILSVVIINTGSFITWANVAFSSNQAAITSPANAYVIVPPPGGHGYEPATECRIRGMGVAFTFANSEGGTIPTNVQYNRIGLITNPLTLNANGTTGNVYTTNTYSGVIQATISPALTFAVGNTITGLSSGALGTVAFSNSTALYLTGDKSFISGETVATSNGTTANITINTIGQVYTKTIKPLYVQNISNISRSANTSESFKMVITI
jgi:hypothetical protein